MGKSPTVDKEYLGAVNDILPPPDEDVVGALVERILVYAKSCDIVMRRGGFHPFQVPFVYRAVESILLNDGAQVVAEFCRQSGKTQAVAAILPALCAILPALAKLPEFNGTSISRFRGGIQIGIFAPSGFQAKTLYRRTCDNAKSSGARKDVFSKLGVRAHVTQERIVFSNGSTIEPRSAAPTSHIESSTYDLIVCDEVQDIDGSVLRKSIHPMLTATYGTIIKTGTPKEDISDCDLYDIISTASSGDPNIFIVDCDEVVRHNPVYQRSIDREREYYGEDSIEFQMSYKLVWPTASGMFMPTEQFEGTGSWAGRGFITSDEGFVHSDYDGVYVAGVDWAKDLGDTAIVIMRMNPYSVRNFGDDTVVDTVIVNIVLLHGENYEVQYPKLKEVLRQYNVVQLHTDGTKGSVGDPLADRLCSDESLSDIVIIPVPFTSPEKSRLYKNFRADFQAGRIQLAARGSTKLSNAYREAKEQFTHLVKSTTLNNLLSVSKNKKRKGSKDDIPDAVVLANDAARSWVGCQGETGEDPLIAGRYRETNPIGARRTR